jgi:hypothetical protein
VVDLNFGAEIVAIQLLNLVASHVTILALTKSPGNVTHSSVRVRISVKTLRFLILVLLDFEAEKKRETNLKFI